MGLDVDVDKPDWICATQASVIQFFRVGATMMQAPLTIEIYMALIQIINCIAPHVAAEAAQLRLIFYMVFICIFNIIGVVVITVGGYFGPTDDKNIDFICYVEISHREIGWIFALVPFLTTVCVIVFFAGLTIWQLSHVLSDLSAAGRTEDGDNKNVVLHTIARFDERGKLTVFRLVSLPLLLIGVSTVELVYEIKYYNSSNDVPAVIAYCLTAGAPVFNFLVWILTDRLVLMEWVRYLSCRVVEGTLEGDDNDFAGPKSFYENEEGGAGGQWSFSFRPTGASQMSTDASVLGNMFMRPSGSFAQSQNNTGSFIGRPSAGIGRRSELRLGPVAVASSEQNPLH